MKVVWTPEAADDLEQLLTFLSERSPTAAASVAARIDQAVKTIAELPMSDTLLRLRKAKAARSNVRAFLRPDADLAALLYFGSRAQGVSFDFP